MKPAPFDYVRATSAGHATELLGEGDGQSRLLAGGQSLLPLLNQRLASADRLVDIAGLPELAGISVREGEVRIGSGVTSARLEDGEVPGTTGRYLATVAAGVGYRGVRNRGTLGGGAVFGDPAADWPAALLAIDATLVVTSARGSRTLPIGELYAGPYATTLAPDELVSEVRLPELSGDARWAYWKFCPTIGEVTKAIGVAVHDPDRGVVSLTLGAAGGPPLRLPVLEQAWRADGADLGRRLDVAAARELVDSLGRDTDDFKTQCLAVALLRAVEAAA